MEKDCIFCKIVRREAPATIEYEDSDVIVFQNIQPIAPVHVLLVPKKHIVNLSEVTEKNQDLMGKILVVAGTMARKLGIKDAFRVAVANGENAGQTVFHLHFHITGGWQKKYNRDEDKA